MSATKWGPTPRLGVRQKEILRVVKSTPIHPAHLRNKWSRRWPHNPAITVTLLEIDRSVDGLRDKGLVEFKTIKPYGVVLAATQKGKAIAARKGVLA